MTKVNPVDSAGRRYDWMCTMIIAIIATAVYFCTLANYVFPGESAHMLTAWTGLDTLDLPLHPLWGACVAIFAKFSVFSNFAIRVNLLSLVCGVLSAVLVFHLVSFFVRDTVSDDSVTPHACIAGRIAGCVASLAFVFSTTIWQASTHLEYRIFDVTFALAIFALYIPLVRMPRLVHLFSVLIGLAIGVGCVESVIFFPLLPLYFLLLLVVIRKQNQMSEEGKGVLLPLFLVLISATVSFGLYTNCVISKFFSVSGGAASGEFDSPIDVAIACWRIQAHEVYGWFTHTGWMVVELLAVLPFVACGFASLRGLNNDRKWSQYLFHLAMTVFVIAAFATPMSPGAVMRPFGMLPVATSALVAIAAGYLVAYWYLLVRASVTDSELEAAPFTVACAKYLGWIFGSILSVVLVVAAVVNAFSCGQGRGRFADVCADEVLNDLGSRTWFVTDGMLDDHLRILAHSRGRELNLVCLQRDFDEGYMKRLHALVAEKGLKADDVDLSASLTIGVLPFLQDWFSGDDDIASKAAVFSTPDFWYNADCVPVPQSLVFGGIHKLSEFDAANARASFEAFWKRMSPILWAEKPGSFDIVNVKDPVERMRLQLRRHMGFRANNLAVVLQDCKRDEDAFALYELVLNEIDPDNICALFNEFEMARTGFPAAKAKAEKIESSIKALVDDPTRRYLLWSLSRYYGYIRSPEIFIRLGYAWALSGQTGAAISQIRRAADLVPEDRRSGLLSMMANIYAVGNETEKSRETYLKIVDKDPGNRNALMGLARLSLQEGDVRDARQYLTEAVKTADKKTSNVEWAIIHLMNNDLDRARMMFQKATDLQPRNLQVWSLLGAVVLQQADQAKDEASRKKSIEEIENILIPRMEAAAGNPKNYYIQMLRALVLMRKGNAYAREARDLFISAASERPDLPAAGDMILQLDIALDDGDSAEKHAKHILRTNRKSPIANYVLGSLYLKRGEYGNAETFLRASVDVAHPVPAAENDLAEVLRRIRRFDDAEKYARAAVKDAPGMYVAWETLGSILLDQKKDLAKSEEYVTKAIELCGKDNNGKDDVRMYITLAKVQFAKGETARARGTLRKVRSRKSELSAFDLDEIRKLEAKFK